MGRPGTPREAPCYPFLWDRCVHGQVLLEGLLEQCASGGMPCRPFRIPNADASRFPGELGQGPLSPRDHPQESGVTSTISSAHRPPPDRQQCPHHPGAGGAACVPALRHPGWETPPGEALAQGWPARECGTWWYLGREGSVVVAPHLCFAAPCFGVSSFFLPLSCLFLEASLMC